MVLKVVIIGAGLGGLAAAVSIKTESPQTDVLVLESASALAEVRQLLTISALRIMSNSGQ